MPVPMSGDPVRIAFSSSTANASTQALSIYPPGSSTARILQPYEQLVIASLLFTTYAGNGGDIFILSSPASTVSTSTALATLMLQVDLVHQTTGGQEWHDDGTGAMTGLPGVVPSVFGTTGSYIYITGTGLVVASAPALSGTQGSPRNPQFANLTQNSTGNA